MTGPFSINYDTDTKQILAGCPQCSVLSGLLFNLFINYIFQLVAPNIESFLYADNATLKIAAENEIKL